MLYICPIAHSVTSKYLFDKLIKRPFSAKNTTCPPHQSFEFLLNDKVIGTLAD